jgi:hypothetical protein
MHRSVLKLEARMGPRWHSPHCMVSLFTTAKIMSAAQSRGGLGGLTCEKTGMHKGLYINLKFKQRGIDLR